MKLCGAFSIKDLGGFAVRKIARKRTEYRGIEAQWQGALSTVFGAEALAWMKRTTVMHYDLGSGKLKVGVDGAPFMADLAFSTVALIKAMDGGKCPVRKIHLVPGPPAVDPRAPTPAEAARLEAQGRRANADPFHPGNVAPGQRLVQPSRRDDEFLERHGRYPFGDRETWEP